MLNFIDYGEHAGSGVPDIFQAWKDAGLNAPIVEEMFGGGTPDRTILTLPLVSSLGTSLGTNLGIVDEANEETKKKLIIDFCQTSRSKAERNVIMNSRKGIDIVMFVMGILMLVCSFFEYNNKGFNLNIVLTVCSIVIISISLGRLLGRNIDTSRGETILRKDVVFVTAGEENSYNEEDKIELDPMLVIRKTLLFAFAGVIFLFVVVRQFQFDEKALTEIEINEKTYYEKNDGDVCITDELDTVYLLDSRFASSQVKDFLETHQNKRVILSVNDKNKIFSIQDAETMILDSDKVKRVYRFNMIFFFTLGVIMCVAAGCLILYNSNGIRIYMPGKIRK